MKKRVYTERGVKYDALAKGYKILKLPLADSLAPQLSTSIQPTRRLTRAGERRTKLKGEVVF